MVSLVAACGPFHQTLPFSFHQNNLDIDWHKGMAFYEMKYRWGICFYRKLWILCVFVFVCCFILGIFSNSLVVWSILGIRNWNQLVERTTMRRNRRNPTGNHNLDGDSSGAKKSGSFDILHCNHSNLELLPIFFFCLQSNIKSSSLPKGWMLQLVKVAEGNGRRVPAAVSRFRNSFTVAERMDDGQDSFQRKSRGPFIRNVSRIRLYYLKTCHF